MDPKRFLGLLDMIDGGGAGRAGPEFEGGPLSGLLNALGIKPHGAGRAMDASPRPVARPPGLGAPPPRPAPPPPGVPPEATSTALPPTMQELMAAFAGAPRGPQMNPSAPQPAPTSMMPLMDVQRMMEAERQRRFREMLAQPLPPLR
jgi:hypothetical protein